MATTKPRGANAPIVPIRSKPRMNDVMFDAETLGTYADSVILSIGAVKFDLVSGAIDDEAYYASISVDSNLEHGRKITESTLLWWLKQEPAAQAVFFEPKTSLEAAFSGLSDWLGGHTKARVWSNGADFDIPMFAHAFRSLGMDVPWDFWNARCFRTYKNLPAADKVSKTTFGTKHNALHDAITQVKHLQAIHAAMKAPE